VIETTYQANLNPQKRSAPVGSVTDLLSMQSGAPETLIEADSVGVPCPVSLNQASLYFMWKLAPDSPAFNVVLPAKLLSPVDVSALREAIQVSRELPLSYWHRMSTKHVQQALVVRHSSLRTTFRLGERGALQLVRPPEESQVQLLVEEMGHGVSEEEVLTLLDKAAHCAFDLHAGPVWHPSNVIPPA
jgi:hypothetical protein